MIKVGKRLKNKGFLDNVADKVFLRWEEEKTLENVGLEGILRFAMESIIAC